MEPLYAALSFAAVALVLINVGRYALARTRAKRAQRHLVDHLEPVRHADETTVAAVEQTYGLRLGDGAPIYEVTGPVEATSFRSGAVSGHLFYIGHVEIAPKSVVALADEGILLENFLPGASAANRRIETPSVRAERLRGDDILVDRFAGGDASLRHIEFCFAEGDDPKRAACYVLSFDGRRIA